MNQSTSNSFGSESIGKLLIKQAVPASIGILVMSLNILVDTIFVGHWIGSQAIAAINVVLPVSFFIAALGMAIGIGGSSIVSRVLGANEKSKALKTFGNQVTMTIALTLTLVFLVCIILIISFHSLEARELFLNPLKHITKLFYMEFLFWHYQ